MHDPEEEKRERQIEQNERLERRRIADLRATMSTASGRRTMWSLLGQTGVFDGCFDADALRMARNVGLRDFGAHLFRELNEYCLPQYLAAQREAADMLTRLENGEAIDVDPVREK